MRQAFTILAILLTLAPAAETDLLPLPAEPDFERRWQFEQAGGQCVLKQALPLLGELRFRRGPGQPLRLQLETRLPLNRAGDAELGLGAPPWRGGDTARSTLHLRTLPGRTPLVLAAPVALDLFQGLYDGRQLELVLPPQGEGLYRLQLAVTPIGFRAAADAFAACVARIVPAEPPAVATGPAPTPEGQGPDAGPVPAQALIDERRLHREAPDPRLEQLQSAPAPAGGEGLAYRRGGEGHPPVRIRIP